VVEVLATPGETIFDPFCGAGYTAKAAIAKGCNFLGVELNQARANKTLAILKAAK
jgi:DNA modification methylase